MPQSLAQLYTHLIFSTKNRAPTLRPEIRDGLQAYLGGALRKLQSPCITARCVADHVHILYLQSKNLAPSKVVEEIKRAGSKWVKEQGAAHRNRGFYWQRGYGMFSVSASKVAAVKRYIHGQEEHHRRKTFQDEFREFLREYGVEYDERYVWD